MSTLENVNDSPTGQHTHAPSLATGEATERCPWCGQPIERSEYTRITKEIEARERARLEKAEKALSDHFERQAKSQAEKARRDAAKAAEEQIKTLKANQEKIINQRLQAQRATFDKSKSDAVNAEKEKYFREKVKLEEKLQEMQRRLQKKSINELGDEGELDLFEQLKHAFPNDQIERIKKGRQGGDILHQIVGQKGQICGKILYEVKNTSRFMTKYLTDLRANQLREAADHGVLSTLAFPTGAQQVAVRENLVIVHPARAVAVATLLRRQVVEVHALRLGREGREQKAQALYGFLISSRARELWDGIAKAAEDFRALDQTEKSAHEKVWGRRADLIRAMQSSTGELASAVDRIVSGT
jgi:hypothetical protein